MNRRDNMEARLWEEQAKWWPIRQDVDWAGNGFMDPQRSRRSRAGEMGPKS